MTKIGEIEISLTAEDGSASRRPRILAAHRGKNATGVIVREIPILKDYISHIEKNVPDDALLLKYDDGTPDNRLVFAPTNYSSFYENRYGGTIYTEHVWRDFYYAITWAAFSAADAAWGADEIELNHIYGTCRWPTEMLGCQLEALLNLQGQVPLHLRRVRIGCGSDDVAAKIAKEIEGPFNPPRPVEAEVVSCSEYGLDQHPAIELTRVVVPMNLENTTAT